MLKQVYLNKSQNKVKVHITNLRLVFNETQTY